MTGLNHPRFRYCRRDRSPIRRLRRRGPWPRRGDSRGRFPSRRSAPLASSSSRSLFSTVISASHQATCQCAVKAHGAHHSDRRSSVLAVSWHFVVLGGPPPSVGGSNPRSSIRAWAAGRCGFAVTGVSCDDSFVKSESPGSNAARVGAFLLGKRNTVLVTTLPERGFFSSLRQPPKPEGLRVNSAEFL